MVQLSYPYMTTGKTILLTIQTFVGKVLFLLFIMLSRLVIVVEQFPYALLEHLMLIVSTLSVST